uniref:Tudor domain-containing protein n=1 Tax=Globodera rostochiensis TaxID=31243 RepID=A0A914GRE6_GLORO
MSSTVSESGSDKILFQKKSVERDNYELDDAEFVKMYDRTTAKSLNNTHNSGINDSSSLAPQQGNRKWKVGDQCMAPYEADGKWYPAQIEEISVGKKACTVSYTGYEQKAILKLEDLLADSDVEAAEDAADQEAEETSGATKIADSAKKDAFPIPDLCPPPPPSMFGKIAVAGTEKEALTNMLMSWYMSGYHTGFYQGVMHAKTSQQKPK